MGMVIMPMIVTIGLPIVLAAATGLLAWLRHLRVARRGPADSG